MPLAKGRQKLSEGQGVKGVVKLPQVKARDAAGKAAGVSGSYVDKASDPEALADFREAMKGQGKRNDIPNILYNIKEVQAGTGKAYTLSRLKRETPELFAAVVRACGHCADAGALGTLGTMLAKPPGRAGRPCPPYPLPEPAKRCWRAAGTQGRPFSVPLVKALSQTRFPFPPPPAMPKAGARKKQPYPPKNN